MLLIRPAEEADSSAMAEIYNHYALNTIVTFEEASIAAPEMARRLGAVASASLPWLAAEDGGRVAGYAYATPWKSRPAYRFSVEITVYVARQALARGIGSALYEQLFAALHNGAVHSVIGGIALPNDASIALHQRFGMVKVAHFAEVGFKLGRWIDVGYWQRAL